MWLGKNSACAVLIALATACLAAKADAAVVYNAANDFSSASNPNSPWTYGYYAPTDTNDPIDSRGPFVNYTQSIAAFGSNGNVKAWGAAGLDFLTVFKNTGPNTETIFTTIKIGPGVLALHPGEDGQYSVVRFTAQFDGEYSFTALFDSIDTTINGATDIYILHNGDVLDATDIAGPDPAALLSRTLTLAKDDTLEFLVGYGAHNDYRWDATSLDLTITAVTPEPASMVLWGIGAAGCAILGLRRRQQLA